MAEEEKEELKELLEGHFKRIEDDLSEIKRGLYGDEKNKIPGALDRLTLVEEDVDKIHEVHKKAKWLGAGFIAALQGIGFAVYEFFKK